MDSTSSKPGVLRRMGAVGATLLLMGGVVVATGSPADATVSGFSFGGIADWDRDGHQDIITRESASGLLWLYPGQSTRGYTSTPRTQIGNGWNAYTFAEIADWDRDGHQDIIGRDDRTGLLWLYPGQSTRGYSSTPRIQIGNGW